MTYRYLSRVIGYRSPRPAAGAFLVGCQADAAPREAGGGQVDNDEFASGLNHFACVSAAVVVIKSADLSDISTVKRPEYWGPAGSIVSTAASSSAAAARPSDPRRLRRYEKSQAPKPTAIRTPPPSAQGHKGWAGFS